MLVLRWFFWEGADFACQLWFFMESILLFVGEFSVKSGEWKIVGVTSSEADIKFPCCNEPYSTITYEIDFERMSLYYFLYIILPLVSQVFLFLLIFRIPFDTGERMGFGVTILLSITVYLLVISEKLPEKSDNAPMLGICFILEFYILSTGLVAAAMTVLLSRRKTRPPQYLIRFANYLNSECNAIKTTPKKRRVMELYETHGIEHDEDCKQSLSEDTENEIKEKEEDENREAWAKICYAIDRFLFYFFAVLVLLVPMTVCAFLDRTYLGI